MGTGRGRVGDRSGPGAGQVSLLGAAAIVASAVLLFWPATAYPFLNWDDREVFVANAAWRAPGFVPWAFTTTYMEHFQPIAWLTWGAIDRLRGLTPFAAHALNVVLHATCAALVFVVSYLLFRRIDSSIWVAVFAALLFTLHPLRVEVVAWASAMPYMLAVAFALASAIIFLGSRERPVWLALAVVLFALSLLARPIALGLPVALLAVEWWRRSQLRGARIVSLLAFYALAVAAAFLEWRARSPAPLSEIGLGARLTLASAAPFVYLWKTVVPVNLTPLDPLALRPRASAAAILGAGGALVAISAVVWHRRRIDPATAVAWISYLALLVPAIGLAPSGLQATADRYMYLPAVPVSMWIAGFSSPSVVSAFSRTLDGPPKGGRYIRLVMTAIVAALAVASYQQMQHWSDSIALWTRAVDIDPANDVALYNLASAFAEAGRRQDALVEYDKVLRIVPDHADARRNRDLLRAAVLEEEANQLAASGNIEAAVDRYRDALALDPARTHSQAALGMALVQIGRVAEALPPLREAVRLGAPEPAVANALAFSLFSAGRTREACEALEAARKRFPDDADVARNLARLSEECDRIKEGNRRGR